MGIFNKLANEKNDVIIPKYITSYDAILKSFHSIKFRSCRKKMKNIKIKTLEVLGYLLRL